MTDGIDCEGEKKSRQLVDSLLHMAERLGYDVVVEGVERQEQLDVLKEMGGRILSGLFCWEGR